MKQCVFACAPRSPLTRKAPHTHRQGCEARQPCCACCRGPRGIPRCGRTGPGTFPIGACSRMAPASSVSLAQLMLMVGRRLPTEALHAAQRRRCPPMPTPAAAPLRRAGPGAQQPAWLRAATPRLVRYIDSHRQPAGLSRWQRGTKPCGVRQEQRLPAARKGLEKHPPAAASNASTCLARTLRSVPPTCSAVSTCCSPRTPATLACSSTTWCVAPPLRCWPARAVVHLRSYHAVVRMRTRDG
jgi:hypothetical protein